MEKTRVFLEITDVKCRAAEAWIKAILQPSKDTPHVNLIRKIVPEPAPKADYHYE